MPHFALLSGRETVVETVFSGNHASSSMQIARGRLPPCATLMTADLREN